ncbi:putative Transcription activator effector binding protein [Verrucomicrobia bacterium]|nr:putative Transcription activator effector binding protein [Verrucomicrobiota bacterium]
MRYQVELSRVEALNTAVIRARVAPKEMARVVPAACGEVWSFMRGPGLPTPGRHLTLYLDAEGSIECGAEVSARFTGNERIVCSRTPGGLVATTTHLGPYGLLSEAHSAVRRWCSDHGHRVTGVSWELYGHWKEEWNNDPSKILTDVYYLIQPEG